MGLSKAQTCSAALLPPIAVFAQMNSGSSVPQDEPT